MWRALAALLCALGSPPVVADNTTPVEEHGRLQVAGNRIVGRHGEPVSLAGPSLFWGNKGWSQRAAFPPDAYYNADVVRWVRAHWGAPIIRIAMGVETRGGYLEDPEGRWAKIEAVAEAAIAEGMYFIVDWHSHHAEDHPDAAVAFFEKVARRWGNTPNLVYETYNEPLDTTDWSMVVKPYHQRVIAAIRAIDPDNLILAGTQTWSQDVDTAADDPIEGDPNLAYTLHFYAGTHRQELRDKAAYALDQGLALFVSEWGTVNANGDGGVDAEETRLWMDFIQAHQLSHLNWSLHSKEEGASMLAPGSPPDANWTRDNFTESGQLVAEIIRQWPGHSPRPE